MKPRRRNLVLSLLLAASWLATACGEKGPRPADNSPSQSATDQRISQGFPSSEPSSPQDVTSPQEIPPSISGMSLELPPSTSTLIRDGLTLDDLIAMAVNQGLVGQIQRERVIQAEEEVLRLEDLLRESDSRDEERLAEIEQINEAAHLADAARSAYSLEIADQVGIVQKAYYSLLSERSKVRSLMAMRIFLEDLIRRVTILVQAGEAPPSWLDLLEAAWLENDRDFFEAQARETEQGAILVRATGGMPQTPLPIFIDIVLPDLSRIPPPDLKLAAEVAVDRSLTIEELFHQREAAFSRARREALLLQASPYYDPELSREHAIAAEEAKAAELTAKMAETEGRIREQMVVLESDLRATLAQYQTILPSIAELESAFISSRVQVESGDMELLDLIKIVENVVEARHTRDLLSLSYLILEANVDRLVLGGPYRLLPLSGEVP